MFLIVRKLLGSIIQTMWLTAPPDLVGFQLLPVRSLEVHAARLVLLRRESSRSCHLSTVEYEYNNGVTYGGSLTFAAEMTCRPRPLPSEAPSIIPGKSRT
jgi:hypothetical protein